MKYIIAILMSSLVLGCARFPFELPDGTNAGDGTGSAPIEVPLSLIGYRELFQMELDRRGIGYVVTNVQIEYGETSTHEYAECVGSNLVVIDEDRFEPLLPDTKELVMFHALAHCVFSQGHRDHLDSVMNSGVRLDAWYQDNRDDLLDELFSYSFWFMGRVCGDARYALSPCTPRTSGQ